METDNWILFEEKTFVRYNKKREDQADYKHVSLHVKK